ncbi:MAG: hypothetical protein P0Y49_13820 [Candidatus Pedobacter colombiensis]|uniref:Uncharacterized protein n=1 Tax=Candidatus Pedobacter colombiensis TaxID=3121371 RepID=A0AAJ5W7B0_9SPHI|nr:hypothetical protein [Pedobacter sp.]WEK17877.1 MAG: hypothetical protein P0Y49_13820 [Pedobacter sp.]
MTEYSNLSESILICLLRADDHLAFQELAKRQFKALRNNRAKYVDESPEIIAVISFTIQKIWDNRHELDDNTGLFPKLLGVIIPKLFEVLFESDRSEEHLFALGEYLKRGTIDVKYSNYHGTN